MTAAAPWQQLPTPATRRLRIYSFDPSLAGQHEMVGIAEVTIGIPWEKELKPGPIGEYVEVVDVDPASDAIYAPVDLDDPKLLAQDGLAPSEANPQFHQQMVYAVAMATIGHFERALGRVARWATQRQYDAAAGRYRKSFVRRLRIYPHALRDRNAYYSPQRKAVLLGYFTVERKDRHNAPGTLVFTCLSHDIIAHEVTHALLDGVHPRFAEPTNADVLAFHEAFADIVALFQHFAYPGVLRDQIARSRGNLANESLLAQLAQQFGRAAGHGGALRDALGAIDPETGKWAPRPPDPRALETTWEPHGRGAILVAAVFGAFAKVYRARTRDLFRIATNGSGLLPEGDIHPDLAGRLAQEAAATAMQILQMCIRAIDYCPPVGITFGDFLRGIVTADHALSRQDEHGFRLAIIESFRDWGIHPEGMRSLGVESLLWPEPSEAVRKEQGTLVEGLSRRSYSGKKGSAVEEAALEAGLDGKPRRGQRLASWDMEGDRAEVWSGVERNRWIVWRWLMFGEGRRLADEAGLLVDPQPAYGTLYRAGGGLLRNPAVEPHTVRIARRRTDRGELLTRLVVEVTQRRRGYYDPEEQSRQDARTDYNHAEEGDFTYRSGATLIIDPIRMRVLRLIRAPYGIIDEEGLRRQRAYLLGAAAEAGNAFYATRHLLMRGREPFALLHRH